MSHEATILHADVDAFFASVAQRDDPALLGKPVIVGSGVVLAASYEARAYGVRSAMGGAKARRLCPQAAVVSPSFSSYVEAGKALFAVFRETAPVVEGLSMEEAFLDVRGLERISGSPREIAAHLRREVREQVGLPLTVGVARTKSLAKVASSVAKPQGLLVVAPEGERAFLHPLRVERLWGAGPATVARLHAHGIATVGQLAALSEAELMTLLGKATGRHIHALAHSRDPRRVRAGRRRRSIGSQSALGRGARTPQELDAVLVALVDRVTRRMRKGQHAGRTVVLRLRFGDYARATRSRTLARATAATATILEAARALLAAVAATIARRGLTLLGITVTNLEAAEDQLALPVDDLTAGGALDAAVDDVRERFGHAVVTRAVLLEAGEDVSPALDPAEQPRRRPARR